MSASYLIFFKSRGTLIQTRSIFEEGCYGFANFVVHIGNSPSIRHIAEQGGIPHERVRDAYYLNQGCTLQCLVL